MRALVLLVACVLSLSCTPPAAPREPRAASVELAASFVEALEAEARDPLAAEPYLALLDRALERPDDPRSLAAVIASLDALVWRQLGEMQPGIEHAIAHRSREAMALVSRRLRAAWARADRAPFQRSAIAQALHTLALRVGAPKAAARWRRRSGCAPEAAVVGPVGWPPLGALERASPLASLAPLPPSLPGTPPFSTPALFEKVYADACTIEVTQASTLRGLRLVLVDVHNPRAQTLHVALDSSFAARVEMGGRALLARPFALGGESATVLARARAEAGTVRIVARVAYNQDGRELAIRVLDERGEPLRMHAPRPKTAAPARVLSVEPVAVAPDTKGADLALAVAALLGAGHRRRAAPLFERADIPTGKSVALDLLRMRALGDADLIPRNQLLLRIEPIAERLVERCAGCWEARMTAASVKRERHGFGVGGYRLLAALGVDPNRAGWERELDPMLLAFVAVEANGLGLPDVARRAYGALARKTPGSALLADVDWAVHRRTGADEVAAACEGGTHRASPRCLQAHLARSDLARALEEMERLRALRGTPALHRETEIAQLLEHGRRDEAMRIYDALPPGRRALALLGAFASDEAQRRFARDRLHASDAPWSYQPLATLLGVVEDRAPALEREGAALVARDRAKPFLPGAATAVLRRLESYALDEHGVLHYWLYDLRRVSGTSDVAGGTWSGTPLVEGRRAERLVRQRIHKKDGRVLDPDPRSRAAQHAAELSQLEPGDYVEAITEGWALPDDDGQLVVDTPDIMPLRTSVRDGRIELAAPAVAMDLWAHPLLGAAKERRDGKRIVRSWRLKNQAPRRVEEGVPPLEARVGISFGTRRWAHVARALGDRFRALDERDPYVKRWIDEQLAGEKLSVEKQVGKIVAAVGKTVARGELFALADEAAALSGGPQRETARWILEQGTGSRTWVVHRALRELGLKSQIAVAETTPFSASPGFPVHTGRFTHPLVRAEIDGKHVWIDADVDGPPLPPGRVSPELRGRQALTVSGELLTVEAQAAEDVDEIDVRLTVDERGDATGTFTALLHGSAAQGLAQAFETVVGSEREQLLRGVVLGWLPWADVRKVTLSSDEGSWQVSLRADITVVGFARPEGRDAGRWTVPGIEPVHSVFPVARATTLAGRYAAQAERTEALAIDEPLLYHVRRRIELPPGARIGKLAPELALASALLRAERRVDHQGSVITEDFRLNLPVGAIGADAYAAFVRELRRVDDAFLHGTRIELSKAGKAP